MGRDSFGQATIKTGISKAYLVEMARGKVPSRAYVDKLISGYQLSQTMIDELLLAAGYAVPKSMVEQIKQMVANGTLPPELEVIQIDPLVIAVKHGTEPLSEKDKEEVQALAKRHLEETPQ
jgi:hypothetical protein